MAIGYVKVWGNSFLKGLQHRWVGVGVRGARHQVVVVEAMEQGVDAAERVAFAEAFLDLPPQDRAVEAAPYEKLLEPVSKLTQGDR